MLQGSFRDKSEKEDAEAFLAVLRRGVQVPMDEVDRGIQEAYDLIDQEDQEKTTGSDLSETDR